MSRPWLPEKALTRRMRKRQPGWAPLRRGRIAFSEGIANGLQHPLSASMLLTIRRGRGTINNSLYRNSINMQLSPVGRMVDHHRLPVVLPCSATVCVSAGPFLHPFSPLKMP